MMAITLSHEELSNVCNDLKCTEENCTATFKCSANLRMHLVKHHNLDSNLSEIEKDVKFACPVTDCKYSLGTSNHFAKKKYLKQHYLKCHAPKNFSCHSCEKKFPTEATQIAHTKSCGSKYHCCCGWAYTSREALLTHCKRKTHKPAENNLIIIKKKKEITNPSHKPNKYDSKKKVNKTLRRSRETRSAVDKNVASNSCNDLKNSIEENTVVKVCISSPPHSKSPRHSQSTNDVTVFPTHYIAAIALSELSTTFIIPKNCHIGVQTVDIKTPKKRSPVSDKKRKNSQETQTAGNSAKAKQQKISAETQTIVHFTKKQLQKYPQRKRKISIETQTKEAIDFLSCVDNESLDANIFNDSSLSECSMTNDDSQKESSEGNEGTEWNREEYPAAKKPFITVRDAFNINNEFSDQLNTNNITLDKLCNIETQTELDGLLHNDCEGTSTIETQTTDEFFNNLYSNTCTQTCDNVDDLFDFDFVDIETQTAWPDL